MHDPPKNKKKKKGERWNCNYQFYIRVSQYLLALHLTVAMTKLMIPRRLGKL